MEKITKEQELNSEQPQEPQIVYGQTPPSLIERNAIGLIKNKNYYFNTDGFINWRKMIKPEFLVPNKQLFEKRNRAVPTSIEGLEDKELLILLGGIKDLAQIRGFTSVNYTLTSSSPEYVAAVCSINWLPNYETENNSVIFSAIGDAHPKNTNSFGQNFLGPIAENRAFVRCVRNFLKINIVSQEEIGGNSPFEDDHTTALLKKTLEEHGISFDKLRNKLIEEKFENADKLTCLYDLPKFKQLELITRIKSKAAAKTIKVTENLNLPTP